MTGYITTRRRCPECHELTSVWHPCQHCGDDPWKEGKLGEIDDSRKPTATVSRAHTSENLLDSVPGARGGLLSRENRALVGRWPPLTQHRPGPEIDVKARRFYCPWCSELVVADAYDHSFEHQDVAPYSHLVIEEFWPVGLAAHCIAEGVH